MDLLSCPDMPVFEIFQDIDLVGPLWSILKPAIPVSVIAKPVLSGQVLKTLSLDLDQENSFLSCVMELAQKWGLDSTGVYKKYGTGCQ